MGIKEGWYDGGSIAFAVILVIFVTEKRPEDSDYNVNVLTRCVSNKEMGAKKSIKIVPLLEPGEPAVVSLPLSEVDSLSSIQLFIPKELTARIKSIKKAMKSSTALAFKDELKAHKRVLQRLGYTTSEDVVQLKGMVACEISSADELTLAELMFSGVLKDVNVEEMVALLSCFVWQEKLNDAPKPREELGLLFTQLQETARRVATVQLECKVTAVGINTE